VGQSKSPGDYLCRISSSPAPGLESASLRVDTRRGKRTQGVTARNPGSWERETCNHRRDTRDPPEAMWPIRSWEKGLETSSW
jgi:hypothetical protein